MRFLKPLFYCLPLLATIFLGNITTDNLPSRMNLPINDHSTIQDSTFDSEKALTELRLQIKGREKEPAETVFKNIQSYKGMPAGRLLSIMKVAFNKSLGVQCTHCHNPKAWDSEEKPTKQITREMRAMMQTINRTLLPKIRNLKSEQPRINCTTCHRGAIKPGFTIK